MSALSEKYGTEAGENAATDAATSDSGMTMDIHFGGKHSMRLVQVTDANYQKVLKATQLGIICEFRHSEGKRSVINGKHVSSISLWPS